MDPFQSPSSLSLLLLFISNTQHPKVNRGKADANHYFNTQRKLFIHLGIMVPTFFLRVRWRLPLRKSRLFFGEIVRLAVLIQGHVQVRLLAF